MPKFLVETYATIYIGGIEVDADSYHEAAVKAERKIRHNYIEDKGGQKLITGQYMEMNEAEVHLGDWESPERTRFLELVTSGDPPEFEEKTNVTWDGHECAARGDIHNHIYDADNESGGDKWRTR